MLKQGKYNLLKLIVIVSVVFSLLGIGYMMHWVGYFSGIPVTEQQQILEKCLIEGKSEDGTCRLSGVCLEEGALGKAVTIEGYRCTYDAILVAFPPDWEGEQCRGVVLCEKQ